jgi:hypothetical protein
MSLSNTSIKNTYSGNGSTIYFPYTFTLPSLSTGSEVAVYITNSDGVTGNKLTSGYTVDLDNQRVIYPDPYSEESVLASGYKITLTRETPKVQTMKYTGQSFNPKSIEKSLDKTVMMVQEMNDKVSRTLVTNITSEANYGLPEAEAEKVLGWNAAGNGLINYDNPAAAELKAIESATSAAASATLATKQATAAATSATSAASYAFHVISVTFNGSVSQQVTISDANVTDSSNIMVSIRRANQPNEWEDSCYYYVANVIYQTAGSFIVNIMCLDEDGDSPILDPPNETITLNYYYQN